MLSRAIPDAISPVVQFVFIIKTLSLTGGGAEKVLIDVASELARRRHSVRVLTFDPPSAETFYRLADGVDLVPLDCGPIADRTSFADLLKRAAAIRRNVGPGETVIAFMHSAFIPARVGLLGKRVRLIGSEHTVFEHYRRKLIRRGLMPLWPRELTAVSEQMRATFPKPLRDRMSVIANPVARPTGKADTVGTGRKTILAVGSLEEQKGQNALIAAFGDLASEFPDWDLRIVGEGMLRPDLERQIQTLALAGRVFLPGATADIGSEYRKAQLFVMPSLYESFGLATAEALSYGLPVIGFRSCPGTNELVVHERNGLLVDELAPAMRQLMGSPDDRARLSAGLAKDFSLETVCDAWEQLAGSGTSRRG